MAFPLAFSPQEFPSRKDELRSRYDFYGLWYGDASGITTVNQARSNERTAMVMGGGSYAQSFRWFVAHNYSEMVYSHTLARSYSFEELSDAIEASGADDIYLVGWACNFADLASPAAA